MSTNNGRYVMTKSLFGNFFQLPILGKRRFNELRSYHLSYCTYSRAGHDIYTLSIKTFPSAVNFTTNIVNKN